MGEKVSIGDIMKKKEEIKDFIKIFISKVRNSDLPDGGMVIAYNMLFSLFPLIIVTLNIISFFLKGRETEVLKMLQMFPPTVAEFIKPIIHELINSSSAGLISISILLALWTGSKVMKKLMDEISESFSFHRDMGFVKEKLLAILLALALIFAFLVMLVTGPLSSFIYNTIETILGETLVMSSLFKLIILLSPYVFLLIILTIIYKMSVIGSGIGLKKLLPASIFTALSMFVLTAGFTIYMDNFSTFNKTYGSLGGVIVLMLWLFLTGTVMILGGYFASSLMEYNKQKSMKKRLN